MAKASGPTPGSSRRDIIDSVRKQQSRRDRYQGFAIVGSAVLVGVIIIGIAVFALLDSSKKAKRDLSQIGLPVAAAGCDAITTKPAQGNADHRATGEKIPYLDAPPANGPHWGQFLQGGEIRKFYTVDDRPPVEQLVHSLEHGYTILWYDETIAGDDAALTDVRSIAKKFPSFTDLNDKFMAAPWKSTDGESFPDGKHLALTHWSMGGRHGDPEGQNGVWQYCTSVSGPAVGDFVDAYPYTDSPEPSAT